MTGPGGAVAVTLVGVTAAGEREIGRCDLPAGGAGRAVGWGG